MPGLLDSKLTRPLDPTLKGNDLLAQSSLLTLVNNPNIQDPAMSAADKLEQQQAAHMLAETLGGPSAEEQAAQAAANPMAGKRKRAPAPKVEEETVTVPTSELVPVLPAALPAAGLPEIASVNTNPAHKIFFTGRSGAGKSFLAQLLGARVLEFNMPLGALWVGPAPTAEEFARIIAWANGDFAKPNTVERVTMTQVARLLFDMPEFGTAGFLAKYLIKEASQVQSGIVAVTDVQTTAEFQMLKEAGFRHFHVAASQTTMASRNKRQRNEQLAAHLDGQASQLMQREPQGDKKPVVWSDPITASPCQRFYTPEEFKALFSQAPAEPVTGVDL
jgi:hypothetical protein